MCVSVWVGVLVHVCGCVRLHIFSNCLCVCVCTCLCMCVGSGGAELLCIGFHNLPVCERVFVETSEREYVLNLEKKVGGGGEGAL